MEQGTSSHPSRRRGATWVAGASLLAVDEPVATRLRSLEELATIADGLTLERLLFKPQ